MSSLQMLGEFMKLMCKNNSDRLLRLNGIKPSTLNPAPSTPNPQPSTLNP